VSDLLISAGTAMAFPLRLRLHYKAAHAASIMFYEVFMKVFEKFKKKVAEHRLNEEKIYAAVLNEMQQGIRREGLWAKAIAKSEGNENKAKSFYLEYRAQSLADELQEEQNKARAVSAEERIKAKHDGAKKAFEEQERIKKIKKAAKYSGSKYIPD
jgi:hypothetical protein